MQLPNTPPKGTADGNDTNTPSLKKFIFLSKYQYENYELSESDSVLGIFEGENFEAAFKKVLEKYDYLGYSGDRELYTAFEIVDGKPYYKEFTIDKD